MLKILAVSTLLFSVQGGQALAENSVGHSIVTIETGADNRALNTSLWYPTLDNGPETLIADNPVWVGQSVQENAPVAPGKHPLVLLSHGFGGNWRNESWLAADLAKQGFIVAAPDHPGTTSFDRDPAKAGRLDKRPHDISRVLDAVLADPKRFGSIDPDRIAAIGHSLGGWTILELAGAQYNGKQLRQECETYPALAACSAVRKLNITPDIETHIEGDNSDKRISAFVSLDLGLARSFTLESLQAITKPILVLAAGTDLTGMPPSLESGYLMQHLPKPDATYVEIADAAHFSFMGECKPAGRAIVEDETPGDGIVCDDGGKRNRGEIHAEISNRITDFLTNALSLKQY